MALVVPNVGEVWALTLMVTANLKMLLFKNNVTPSETTVAGDLTEATFTGYAAKTLVLGSWSIVSGDPTVASYALQAFTSSADQTLQQIWGVAFVDSGTGVLRWCERFTDGPYNIQTNGDVINVTPKLQAS